MKKILKTPISYEDIKDLRIGDIIYIDGIIATGRDDVYHRVVVEGLKSPFDYRNMVNLHAGPIIKEGEKNTMVAIGPTSSIRMEKHAKDFIKMTGVKILLGKGGMGEDTSAACKEHGAIHCIYPGGCAVSAATLVEEIEEVYWRELGMPEAIWVMRVKEFGPLIVSVDSQGNNMFVENKAYYESRKEESMAPIKDSVKDFMKIE